jgi:hypothetical protein
MDNYKGRRYSLALTTDEQEKYLILKNKNIGIKKIFKKGLSELIRENVLVIEEE